MRVWIVTKQRRDWEEYPEGPYDIIKGYDDKEEAEQERSKLMEARKATERYPANHHITYEIEETEIYLKHYIRKADVH